jgi:hypothetical protein
MGTPYNELISHNEDEEPEVFAARIESLRDGLLWFEEDAQIVRDLLKGAGTVFPLACVFGDMDQFDMSGRPGWHSAPCGHRGENNPTWFGGTRSDEPLALPGGTSFTDRMMQEHQNNLPPAVFNEDFHIVSDPANDWEGLSLVSTTENDVNHGEMCHCTLGT